MQASLLNGKEIFSLAQSTRIWRMDCEFLDESCTNDQFLRCCCARFYEFVSRLSRSLRDKLYDIPVVCLALISL